jgi:hypothetical protein
MSAAIVLPQTLIDEVVEVEIFKMLEFAARR